MFLFKFSLKICGEYTAMRENAHDLLVSKWDQCQIPDSQLLQYAMSFFCLLWVHTKQENWQFSQRERERENGSIDLLRPNLECNEEKNCSKFLVSLGLSFFFLFYSFHKKSWLRVPRDFYQQNNIYNSECTLFDKYWSCFTSTPMWIWPNRRDRRVKREDRTWQRHRQEVALRLFQFEIFCAIKFINLIVIFSNLDWIVTFGVTKLIKMIKCIRYTYLGGCY